MEKGLSSERRKIESTPDRPQFVVELESSSPRTYPYLNVGGWEETRLAAHFAMKPIFVYLLLQRNQVALFERQVPEIYRDNWFLFGCNTKLTIQILIREMYKAPI